MKVSLLVVGLFAVCISRPTAAGETTGQPRVVTNLVEILEYVDTFSKILDIDVPRPLTTNAVTWSSTYLSGCDKMGLRVSGSFGFDFDVRHHLINYFDDRRYSMSDLWRAEDIRPLIRPSKITRDQALEMARHYLVKLGYSEDRLPPLLPPKVHQWKWHPPGAWMAGPLPFFTIEWRWRTNPDVTYCRIEIDGFRQKITEFFIMYPRADFPPSGPP